MMMTSPRRSIVRLLTLTSVFFPAVSAITTSCDPTFNTGFGLGAHTLPPASNVSTADPTGPYQVGVRFETYCLDGRGVTLNYWYPALPVAGSSPYVSAGGIVGKAVRDAPVDSSGGPYPLIVFSPGLAAVDDGYYFYTQNLASSGYVVVSIQHLDARNANVTTNKMALALAAIDAAAGNTIDAVVEEFTDFFRETQFALTYRPQEISFALDQAIRASSSSSSSSSYNNTSSSPFRGLIDTDKIGMSGHSLGGFYTNIVGGGMPIYCDYAMTAAERDPEYPVLSEVSPCAFPARQNQSGPFALHDARIKAVISLAAPTFLTRTQLPRSAAQIRTPMMTITGDNRTSETTSWVQRAIYEAAAGPSHWVKVRDTNHYLVADAYGLNPVLGATASAADKANFLDKAAVYMAYSAAFFDYYLRGNKTADATLQTVLSPYVEELDSRNFS
ncbi:alpha/beta-hydrolase [Biscogniauxia mediterranea]|nr:alpha/beta-hydrolase [Biscogniauxia mediterranea]